MRTKLINILDRLGASFWFVPALMAMLAAALGLGLVEVDRGYGAVPAWGSWLYTGSAEGASTVLATIVGSMITIVGLVFSITIVALTLASTQFGPRLLRTFMRDRATHIVLGTFLGTFVYSLLVLLAIHNVGGGEFVPHLAVTGAIALTLLSIAVLIYFIHHVSIAIQAPEVIAEVGQDLYEVIDRLFPHPLDPSMEDRSADLLPARFAAEAVTVRSAGTGYIQAIDEDGLIELAARYNLVIQLLYRPGHFLVQGYQLARVWPADRVSKDLAEEINDAFIRADQRTRTHDVEFLINQLTEVAMRALSPAINDPYTAMTCIDWLGATLSQLAGRQIPPAGHMREGRLLLLARPITFVALVEAAFEQLRQIARGNIAVSIRLLEALEIIGSHTRTAEDRAAIRRQAEMIEHSSRTGEAEGPDRADLLARYQAIDRVLDQLDATDGTLSIDPSPRPLPRRRRRSRR
jgi:uncharacterized membrane protein